MLQILQYFIHIEKELFSFSPEDNTETEEDLWLEVITVSTLVEGQLLQSSCQKLSPSQELCTVQ